MRTISRLIGAGGLSMSEGWVVLLSAWSLSMLRVTMGRSAVAELLLWRLLRHRFEL